LPFYVIVVVPVIPGPFGKPGALLHEPSEIHISIGYYRAALSNVLWIKRFLRKSSIIRTLPRIKETHHQD